MWGIRFNNDRGWFEGNKGIYLTHLYQPMKELAWQVQAGLNGRFPQSPVNVKVARIYRDARRLYGRGPYRDHLWFSLFRWDDQEAGGAHPVFWFELGPEEWGYGLGFYNARPQIMEKHRARIHRNPAPLLALHKQLEEQDTFLLEGPEYARVKVSPTPALQSWYNKRSLSVSHARPLDEEIYSPALADRLVEGFTFLTPFYDYFSTIWADSEPKISGGAP